MKRTFVVLAVAVLALGLAPRAKAQPAVEGIKDSSVTTITATVEAIDSAQRMLTVKGPQGNLFSFRVSDAVKRFPEIKVGDKITAKYTESMVVKLQKPGTQTGTTEASGMSAGAGAKPTGMAASQTTVTVKVAAIDMVAPSITVTTADGQSHSFRVKDVKNLEGVKVGDAISVTYTEALAIDVTGPSK